MTPFARTGAHSGRGSRGGLNRGLTYLALVLLCLQAFGPLVWMALGSLKSDTEFYTNIWGLPTSLTLRNYPDAWEEGNAGTYLTNSLMVVALGLAILLVVCILAGYALARLDFPGRSVIFGMVLATMMIPPDILTTPLFVVTRNLGILGNQWTLSLIYASAGFGLSTFLMRGYFMSIPRELEESALIDGAGTLRTLWSVIMPLARPGILTVAILQGMAMWNDLYLAFVFLRRPEQATIPIGMLGFFQKYSVQWPLLCAALLLTSIPVILLYFLAQKWFVRGMTAGAVKG
ncbi:MAG: carbohydrate ABC transporter permease [Kineosporiaceae bacterium]